MGTTAVLGIQWGDEGKAKIVDVICKDADIIARFQGGHNAGHTVVVGKNKYIFHLIPSGIIHPDKYCVIGNGLVIDPRALKTEINNLETRGIHVTGRLLISARAHVILPLHTAMESFSESIRGDRQIGTTLRGIGPCYLTKAERCGIRVADLLEREILTEKIEFLLKQWQSHFGSSTSFSCSELTNEYHDLGQFMEPYIGDASEYILNAMDTGKKIIFEGAQGTMLDVDHGTYPFVTSSTTTVGGICSGLGVPANKIDRIVGISKAYTTRVGAGPFPTELTDETGDHLREKGNEYGSSTGRPRRCGWLDFPVLRYASRINGVEELAITKLDVLEDTEIIKVCMEYSCGGKTYKTIPWKSTLFSQCHPVYTELPGWKCSLQGITRKQDLPPEALQYISFIEKELGIPVTYISTGPAREDIIISEK